MKILVRGTGLSKVDDPILKQYHIDDKVTEDGVYLSELITQYKAIYFDKVFSVVQDGALVDPARGIIQMDTTLDEMLDQLRDIAKAME